MVRNISLLGFLRYYKGQQICGANVNLGSAVLRGKEVMTLRTGLDQLLVRSATSF